jgi:hypothetical protein
VSDLPGFGFAEVPAERKYPYTFGSLSLTIEAFFDALNVGRLAAYIFEYGVRTLTCSLLPLRPYIFPYIGPIIEC